MSMNTLDTSGLQSGGGRSPDCNLIYQQYLADYGSINPKISAIDRLPYDQRNQPYVQEARAKLIELQKELDPLYRNAYNNSNQTLADYQKNSQSILEQVDVIYTKAIGGGLSIHEIIEEKVKTAEAILNSLNQGVANHHGKIDELESQKLELEQNLARLQGEINELEEGDKKEKALQKYEAINLALTNLSKTIAEVKSNLNTLQQSLSECSLENGIIAQLHQLSAIENPEASDLELIASLLKMIKGIQEKETAVQTKIDQAVWQINTIKTNISAILNDNTSPIISAKVEHSAWYIDWTSWNYPIPEGVNTVNLFVGNFHLDSTGTPVIDGFGNFTKEKMMNFIQQCHEKGIAVKISLGGGGGSYDHCWSNLKPENVSAYAKCLVDFCKERQLDGVDFDVEEFKSATDRPAQQKLCGQFIKEFKELVPDLSTSLCTNAGFGPYFPWQGVVKNIFDAASTIDPVTGEKTTAVDRLYIMSYYNSFEDEKKWILGWYDWVKNEYGYEASQISVGIDDKDAHAYDIKQMAAFAGEYGFSTGYWEFDPAQYDKSNDSTHAIGDSYDSHIQTLPYSKG